MIKLEKIAEIEHAALRGVFTHDNKILTQVLGNLGAYSIVDNKLVETDAYESEEKETTDHIKGQKEFFTGIAADYREHGNEKYTSIFYGVDVSDENIKFIRTLNLKNGKMEFDKRETSINNDASNLTVLNNNFIATSDGSYLSLYKTGSKVPQNIITQDIGLLVEKITPIENNSLAVMTSGYSGRDKIHIMNIQENPYRLIEEKVIKFDAENLGTITGIHYLGKDRFIVSSHNQLDSFNIVGGKVGNRASIPLENNSIVFNKDRNLMALFRTGFFAPSTPSIEVYNFSLD